MPNPNIVIFNGRLLPPSETFVRTQAEELKTLTPHYVGARRVSGLSLPDERTWVVNHGTALGGLEEILFKVGGFAPKLYQDVQKLNPALIHAHFGVCGALALPIAQALNLPLIVTFHGFDASMTDEYARRNSISTRVYLRRREALKRDTRLFIAVSKFIREKLIKQGFPENRILVHYIGVDTDIFQPDLSTAREPIVLFVGRLTEKKGCEYLIKAMVKVQAIMPEAKLIIIGDGELRASLEQLSKSLLKDCRFLGVQPSQVVREWMNKSTVFSVPSMVARSGDAEGFGMVFAESQAMGLPVVSFASGGIPEAVAHGETGFLAKEKDCDELAKFILRILQDRSLWEDLSHRGQDRVKTKFNLQSQTRLLEELYQTVLKDPS